MCWSSSSELIVRDGWDRGLLLVPSRLVSLFWLLPPHHHLQFLCLLFCLVRLVLCSKFAEMSRGLFFVFLNKGVRGFRQTQMWIHSLPPLTFTALCGPNSLCLLSKDWLGKRPSCAAAPKSQHKVNSSSALINHHFLCKCSFHYERFSETATNNLHCSQIKHHFSQDWPQKQISENSQMTCKGLKINMKMRTLCATPPPSFGLGLTHENAWRGRAFCCQLTIMSWVWCRNANLQPGDRTMKWAIYG